MPSRGGANLLRVRGQFDDEISGKLSKLRDNFDRLGKSKAAQSILMGVGVSVGQAAMRGLGMAVGAVSDAVFDSIGAASDLREAMALAQQVFEKNTDTIDRWADKASTSFGMTKRDALNTAATFGTAFKNVGISLDETTDKAESLTRLAADLGSAFNASSDEAAIALRSGLLGESEPLRKFGVFLDEAKVKAKALAMGFQPVNGAFTDAAKVAARYQLILEQTSDSQGMFGRDAGSLADKQKALNAQLADLSAQIGTELLPVMVELSTWMLEEGVPAIRDFADAFTDLEHTADEMPRDPITWLHDFVFSSEGAEREARILAHDIQAVSDSQAESMATLKTRFSGTADTITSKAPGATGAIKDLGGAAKGTAAALRDLARDAASAADAMLEAIYGPEQLRMELGLLEDDLKADQRELKKLEAIKDPTKEQRRSMEELRLKVSEDREEVNKLRVRVGLLNDADLDDVTRAFRVFNSRGLQPPRDTALSLYNTLRRIMGMHFQPSSYMAPYDDGRASGGPVLPGNTYTVGEAGRERLVMYPGGGGYVIPGGGGSSSSGGASVLNVNVSVAGGGAILTPAQGQAIAKAIGPELTRQLARAR